jgi:two-component system NtrC family sensor kinase
MKEDSQSSPRKSVLIIDDDRIICEQLQNELRRNFFTTFLATSGEQALEIYDREDIDIVILDIMLPDIDGLDLLSDIKTTEKSPEVIVITGYGTQEIAVLSLRRGAIDYIEKPIDNNELMAALGRAIEKISEKDMMKYRPDLLVLDDERESVRALKSFLENEGFRVLPAYSGQEALDLISSNKIDVILADIKMESMDGVEVLVRAKKLYPDIEGIMITAYKDQELAVKALRAGALDYIIKPINLEELLFAVNRALERINLNRNVLYRTRELKISSGIISKMNEELEKRIQEKAKELAQIQGQLFQTSKLATLGEMAAGMAHEMNQPLGAISLIARHIRKMKDKGNLSDAEIEHALMDIESSVKRMAKVIQHIRTFARQDTFKFIRVNVNETIDSALSLLQEQLRLHEITLTLDLDQGQPTIIGEPYQLEQVWINLITNSRDALDEKQQEENVYRKELSISTRAEGNKVFIVFMDNGCGIPHEIKMKIFEPFFTTKEVGKATGLGLSISYGIIQTHKGRIEVESEPGKETVITISFPREQVHGNDNHHR